MAIIISMLFLTASLTGFKNSGSSFPALLFYSLFIPNVGFAFGYTIFSIVPLWSVGVEEQFYAFFPWIINKSRKAIKGLVIMILIYMSVKLLLRFFEHGLFYRLISISSFDSMAIGGIFAWLVFERKKLLDLVYAPMVQIAAWLFFLISLFFKPLHLATIIDNEIHSVIYGIIICNVATNKSTLIRLQNQQLDYIGKISYGIYVYHMIIICIVSSFTKCILFSDPYIDMAICYCLVISL